MSKVKEPTFKQWLCISWGGFTFREVLVKSMAEVLGTMMLLTLGCMSCLPGWGPNAALSVQCSLGFGITITIIIQIFGHVSGAHVNPCVTLAACILGNITIPLSIVYFVSQVAGAIIGYGLLLLVTPVEALGANGKENFCVTVIHPLMTTGQGIISEVLITAILILFCCAVWDPRNAKNTDSTAIKFGLLVAGIVMSLGVHTGASMNPARSLGPAIWTNNWDRQWVYWISPTLGSVIAALTYRFFIAKSLPKI